MCVNITILEIMYSQL